MKEVKSSTVSVVILVLAAGAGLLGIQLRDRVDAPIQQANSMVSPTLVASVENDVTVSIAEGDYFREIKSLVEREYVEKVTDEQKLAAGAVRGMVGSLNDPNSLYYDKKQFNTFLNARVGKYEGVGAEFALVLRGEENLAASKEPDEGGMSAEEALASKARVPRLMVTSLTPGGPADKAGVKPGDLVYSVDNHWVINTDMLVRFQKAQREFAAKKISLSELNQVRKEIRAKTERALLPMRAWERLMMGTKGNLAVTWERNGAKRNTTIAKATSEMPGSGVIGNAYRLALRQGAEAGLKQYMQNSKAKPVRIDLRQNTNGDFAAMQKCLAVLAPTGTYGMMAGDRAETNKPLVVKSGNAAAPMVEFLVDETTRGAAEVLALAMQSKGRAKLVGGKTGGAAFSTLVVQIPDGSGYTLVTGEYKVSGGAK